MVEGIGDGTWQAFAESSLFLNSVQSLAVFNIHEAVGKDDKEIEIDVKPKLGILTYPTPSDFHVEPRSKKHV